MLIPPKLVGLFCGKVVNEQLVGSPEVLELYTFVSSVMHTKRQERGGCKGLSWVFLKNTELNY